MKESYEEKMNYKKRHTVIDEKGNSERLAAVGKRAYVGNTNSKGDVIVEKIFSGN